MNLQIRTKRNELAKMRICYVLSSVKCNSHESHLCLNFSKIALYYSRNI